MWLPHSYFHPHPHLVPCPASQSLLLKGLGWGWGWGCGPTVEKSYLLQQLLTVAPQSPQLTIEQDTDVHHLFLLVFC